MSKKTPLPNDVVGTSTAISLANAMGMSGSTYTAAGTLGCIGLEKIPGSKLPTSMISFVKVSHHFTKSRKDYRVCKGSKCQPKINVSFRVVDQYCLNGRGGYVCHSSICIGEVVFTDENALVRELLSKSDFIVDGTGKTEFIDHFWLGYNITSAVDGSIFACDRKE